MRVAADLIEEADLFKAPPTFRTREEPYFSKLMSGIISILLIGLIMQFLLIKFEKFSIRTNYI